MSKKPDPDYRPVSRLSNSWGETEILELNFRDHARSATIESHQYAQTFLPTSAVIAG